MAVHPNGGIPTPKNDGQRALNSAGHGRRFPAHLVLTPMTGATLPPG